MKSNSIQQSASIKNWLIVFSFFFCFTNLFSQNTYVQVSDKDCFNCYIGFFDQFLNKSIEVKVKFLFPRSYKGKRFENFNELYFKNRLQTKQVVFSDSLFDIGNQKLNGSGLIGVFRGELIFALDPDVVSEMGSKLYDQISDFKELKELSNLSREGVSTRVNKNVSYSKNSLILIDNLYRKIYLWNADKEIKVIDLKSDIFQNLLKKYLSKKDYESHLKNFPDLIKIGKNLPESFTSKIIDSTLFLSYYMPYVRLDTLENGRKSLGVRNLPFFSKIPIKIDDFSTKSIVENSYLISRKNNNRNDKEFYQTQTNAVYNDKLYKINHTIYTKKDNERNKNYPLFTVYDIDEQKELIKFSKIDTLMDNFEFQKDTLLNNKYVINNISFLNDENVLLLQTMPYVVDLNKKIKIKLDWDENLNNLYYPPKINYINLQFWQIGNGFVVLIKYENQYYLKQYTYDWVLKNEIPLPFNGEVIKDIRFSEKFVYLFTENEILEMPNNFVEY